MLSRLLITKKCIIKFCSTNKDRQPSNIASIVPNCRPTHKLISISTIQLEVLCRDAEGNILIILSSKNAARYINTQFQDFWRSSVVSNVTHIRRILEVGGSVWTHVQKFWAISIVHDNTLEIMSDKRGREIPGIPELGTMLVIYIDAYPQSTCRTSLDYELFVIWTASPRGRMSIIPG